jgi:hypothetical protein
MTNRHVAQPWLADDRAKGLSATVSAQPRLKKLMAFFPDTPQSVALKFKLASQREDLAVCSMDAKDVPSGIPVLPLERDTDAVAVGKAVVMMGYPSGPDRLLALMDETEARGIQARYGSLEALWRKRIIFNRSRRRDTSPTWTFEGSSTTRGRRRAVRAPLSLDRQEE